MSRQRRIVEILVGLGVLVAFGIVYGLVLSAYRSENVENEVVLSTGDATQPDRVTIDAKLVTIDPVQGDLLVRLQFTPHGALLSPDQVTLAQPLLLEVNTAAGQAEYTFKKGERTIARPRGG